MERRPYVVDFPTLWVVPAWIERHCVIPDGFRKGNAFRLYDWQLWCTANHYRVNPEAVQVPEFPEDPDAIPIRSAAFHNRRSQVIAPQKTGKGPWAATIVCAEAVGPTLFLDWAGDEDAYECADYACGCGWVYRYQPGEPMGHPWPTPLIQLLATSEDQVDNVYRPLQSMARNERLRDRMKVREGFIRIIGEDNDPDLNRIDVVTSSAQSRLGNPITFCVQDETQLYTAQNKLIRVAETMRRGAAAMGGRSVETTNCYDPAEQSVAQRTFESRKTDIFRFYEPPPAGLKYTVKADRRRIHAFNYAGSPHADVHGINAESEELIEKDPGQAERFFGNRMKSGAGAWLKDDQWESRKAPRLVRAKTKICAGFDGSDSGDWTGIAAETLDGYSFTPTYGPDERPMYWDPAEWGDEIPRGEVDAAMDRLFDHFTVVRIYCDPREWKTTIEDWQLTYGERRVVKWETNRITQMHASLKRFVADLPRVITQDGCKATGLHIGAARKVAKPGDKYILGKPSQNQHIDLAMCRVLAHEARCDAVAAGVKDTDPGRRKVVVSSR